MLIHFSYRAFVSMAPPVVSLTCTFGILRDKKTFRKFTCSRSSQVR